VLGLHANGATPLFQALLNLVKALAQQQLQNAVIGAEAALALRGLARELLQGLLLLDCRVKNLYQRSLRFYKK
jgi:hypothetical protein